MPAGGLNGQVLTKASDNDYDFKWVTGGGGGTSDYSSLSNKPEINGVTLTGNKTANDLNLIQAPTSPAAGSFLVWNGTSWTAQTLTAWQGGNY